MPSFLDRLRSAMSPSMRADRRNIDSLARRLGIPEEDAAWVYRRSREVGFGAAMTEYEAQREKVQVHA